MKHPITLRHVTTHNLKGVNVELESGELIVCTGVSGSGKSSLAFDTLYVEGQRRYVASLSNYARRQLGDLSKPAMESASGITPTISIEQKTAGRNPRSTVGTLTEIYDYLRVLFARAATPHCPVSGEQVFPQSRERIIRTVQHFKENAKIVILAPYARQKKAEFKEDFQNLLRKGFMRARVDGDIIELDEEIALDRGAAHDVDIVIDRLVVRPSEHSRIAESLTQALEYGEGMCIVIHEEEEHLFSMHAYSPASGLSYPSLEPHDFSFNSPTGMCPRCQGMGIIDDFDLDKILDPSKSISEDCFSVGSSYHTVKYRNIYDNLAKQFHFSVKTPWKKLSQEAKQLILRGTDDNRWLKMRFVHPTQGYTWTDKVQWKGVLHEVHRRLAEAKSSSYRKKMEALMMRQLCSDCRGDRLRPYPAAAKLDGKTIAEVTQLTVADCLQFFKQIKLSEQEMVIAEELLKEICERLQFLEEVGLHYLTLNRTAPTLSGGEAQRVRLASQIGCGLVGVTYILDEPSIGLHPRDNQRLIATLQHLRDKGNTVVVVEHDEETIRAADRVLDFGPGAGVKGGELLSNGSLEKLLKHPKSHTAAFLSGRETIEVPTKKRKKTSDTLTIAGAKHHNLKNISVPIPLGKFVCITGVSGSGKSSLITDILYPALVNELHRGEKKVGAHKRIEGLTHLDKVIAIDQTPIGRNPRSNPSTYIKLFDEIRDLFATLPESQARGYSAGRFSFNVKQGSCPQCSGMGMIKIDMDFLEDDWVDCSYCHGRRFDQETLSVYFKGKNIYDVLEMDVAEALLFFDAIPSIRHKLEMLHRVGMDYIKLGQSSTTLSGGEAQRVKLAKELVRPPTGRTLYILDEPTTGLHFHDIQHLLNVLHDLVNHGNSVVVIEHNMDIIKTADWIVDLGPEGGEGGGKLIASGTPKEIAKKKSATAEALAAAFKGHGKVAAPKKSQPTPPIREITVEGAEQNNLKHLDVTLPRDQITVCTGPSGSGKSSFAFETVYSEGQRRYVESLSPYARQFVKQNPKPKVGRVTGLSPAIAIEQRVHAGNPRSTVGTLTEVYDYLRILYARIGIPHCPDTKEVIQAISKDHVVDQLLAYPDGEKIQILAPLPIKRNESLFEVGGRLQRQGYLRIRLNGTFYELDDLASISYKPKQKNEVLLVIDRLIMKPTLKNRLLEAVETAASIGNDHIVIARPKEDVLLNLSFSVASTGQSYPEITPHTFAFNVTEGMCPDCEGLGYQYGLNLTRYSDLRDETVLKLMQRVWWEYDSDLFQKMLMQVLKEERISPDSPISQLSKTHLQILTSGSQKKYTLQKGVSFRWIGLNAALNQMTRSKNPRLRSYLSWILDRSACVSCDGARINRLARHVMIDSLSLPELCTLPLDQTLAFIEKTSVKGEALEEVKMQLLHRLQFLCHVDLNYLSLNRAAPTLSGGEMQRIRLARQLGSGLTGVLYVLDEPTIGLHPRDNEKLNQALRQLNKLGNTLLLVEHDPLTIEAADYLLDFGPEAGNRGGHITAQGTLKQIKRSKHSLTGRYLSGKMAVSTPKTRRPLDQGSLTVTQASLHNLKNLTVSFPLHTLCCLTGVSGSGKSSLLHGIVAPAVKKGIEQRKERVVTDYGTVTGIDAFDSLISIDQKPIGTTKRSNVGTYVGLLDLMRTFFASLPDARTKGLKPGAFSFNHKSGMCTTCHGLGYQTIELHFLPPVDVTCKECCGLRLNPVSLSVSYQNKNFGQYLDTTIDDARAVFAEHPRICRILDTLIKVGLGYLKLGQEMATLSGGEAQRIKLSSELSKRYAGHTLYLMDEPTTGLHSHDIDKLLHVIHELIDKGHTFIIIEHNLDIIRNGDYLIELGPDAGEKGGGVICTGRPEEIAKNTESVTGAYL